MKRNVWGLVAAITLVATAFAIAPLTASAEPTVPTMSAVLTKSGVRVSWALATKAKGRVLELQKSADNGETFTTLLTRTNAPSKGSVVDKAITSRYVTYRSRVIEGDARGSWGTTVAVDTYPALPPNTWACPSGWEEKAIAYINQLRAQINHPPLTANIGLMRATHYRAGNFGAHGRITHAGYASDAKKFGFKAPVGENIGAGGDWKTNIDGWMASTAGHRETLMQGISVVGIGCAISAVGFASTTYWSLLTYRDPMVLWPS